MNLISDRAILASGMLFECFLRHFKSFEQKIFDFRSSGCKLPRYRELCARCNHCCLHYRFGFKTSPWRSPSFVRFTLSFSTSTKYYMSTPRTNKDIHWLYAERKYELLFINNKKKETTYCDLVNERIAPLPFVSHPIFYRLLRSSWTKQGWVFWLRFNGLISVPRWNTEIGVGTKMIWVFSLILPMF